MCGAQSDIEYEIYSAQNERRSSTQMQKMIETEKHSLRTFWFSKIENRGCLTGVASEPRHSQARSSKEESGTEAVSRLEATASYTMPSRSSCGLLMWTSESTNTNRTSKDHLQGRRGEAEASSKMRIRSRRGLTVVLKARTT